MRRRITNETEVKPNATVGSEVNGRSITVTLGREVFSPIQYSTVEVGPISVSADMLDGESVQAAYLRIRGALAVLFQAEFDLKLQDYLARTKAAKTVRGSG